jgi:signal transduction histidine kinase/DNA-binding response OmpR family regulator
LSADTRAALDPGHDVFIGDGEMARLMRAHDWAATPLGPVEHWPQSLKVAIRLLLTSRFEMWLGWGPDIAFFYNDAYRPTLGLKHPRSLGMPTRELWSEIWDAVEPKLRSVYERGEATWDRALRLLIDRHGYLEETYHTFSYSPLLDDAGRVGGVFCAVTEETERVIGERRLKLLRELSACLALAVDEAAVMAAARSCLCGGALDLPWCAVYRFDEQGRARRVLACGFAAEHALAPAELPADGSGVFDLRPVWAGAEHLRVDLPDDPSAPTGEWDRAPHAAVIAPLGSAGRERPRGVLVAGLNPHRPVDADAVGFVVLLAAALEASLANAQAREDERRRSSALTAERDRLRRMFEQAPSFMCLLSGPEHRFELANEAYRQLVGERELLGLSVREALPEVEGQGYFELLDSVYRSGQAFVGRKLEVGLQTAAENEPRRRYVNLVYQPVLDDAGQVGGIFVEGNDVTLQKEAEDALQALNATLEQRVVQRTDELARALESLKRESAERAAAESALRQAQKMESIGALTGGIAHDFNNLLQVISGNLQLLSRHVAGQPAAEKRVASALAGVARGAKLASQLLAFGRRQPLEPKVVNIGRFVRGMDDLLRRALGEEIELETVIGGGLWNNLVDPTQIENALLNLVINARDAMNGRGRLTIEAGNAMLDDAYALAHAEVQPGQYVMVAVTDTGCGIPPEILDRVVEPFFSTKPEGKGTGLGLSMVYGFVKQSGGHMKLYSEVGHGTTVRLYLPRVMQAEDVLVDAAGLAVHGGAETVLVVEDDDEVRDTAVATLADLGYRVLQARDATRALELLESGAPVDLLFTDVVMPGPLRSPELARRAQARRPSLAVLYTSGYTENAIVHGGRLDPGVELLSKPYTREALARKVRHVLSLRPPAVPSDPPAAPPPAATGCSVLLVEDDALVRASVADLLIAHRHEVVAVGNAVSALKALAARSFDVLMTDIGLPGPSGVDLARQALSRWPDMALVFATGHADAAAAAQLSRAVVVAKPYAADELLRAVREASARGARPAPDRGR